MKTERGYIVFDNSGDLLLKNVDMDLRPLAAAGLQLRFDIGARGRLAVTFRRVASSVGHSDYAD